MSRKIDSYINSAQTGPLIKHNCNQNSKRMFWGATQVFLKSEEREKV